MYIYQSTAYPFPPVSLLSLSTLPSQLYMLFFQRNSVSLLNAIGLSIDWNMVSPSAKNRFFLPQVAIHCQ